MKTKTADSHPGSKDGGHLRPANHVEDSGLPKIPKSLVFWGLTFASLVGSVFIIAALSRGQQTPNEALLLSVLLTFLSIGGSWLITHTFYQDDRRQQIAAIRREHEENLRVYAVKAAEKVINLSNQISRLVSFMDAEYYEQSGGGEESYRLLRERMRGSLHMMETLRSMNETSLSDWEGVIGDRLDAKRKIDERRNDEINDLLEELKAAAKEEIASHSVSKKDFQALYTELKDLSAPTSTLPASRKALSAGLECPVCTTEVRLRTNSKGQIKKTAATCPKCKASLAVIGGKTQAPHLAKRESVPEVVSCSSCGLQTRVPLDNAVPANTPFRCDSCGAMSLAIRNEGSISVKGPLTSAPTPPNSELLERVFMLLPPQPWPTGVHHEIAAKLEISPSQVGKMIRQLIHQGRVQDQANGVVTQDSHDQSAQPPG